MKPSIIFLALIPFVVGQQTLLSFDGESNFDHFKECEDPSLLSCRKVSLDFDALLSDQEFVLPYNLVVKKDSQNIRNNKWTSVFRNQEEKVEAIFVLGKSSENKRMFSAGISWSSAGRYFMLNEVNDETLLWMEVDTSKWVDGEPEEELEVVNLTQEQEQQLLMGKNDKETPTTVTVSVHVTKSFRDSFSSDSAMEAFLSLAIEESNQGYLNSNVPIQLAIHCVLDSSVRDNDDLHIMLADFEDSDSSLNSLRRGADIAMLLTAIDAEVCGTAKVNAISSGRTISVVKKSCATGYYTFAHEMAHMYGCYHNRETGSVNPFYPYAYGYLMRPPIDSGFRTILAYQADGYETRINFYSNPSILYNFIPTGDLENFNAALLAEQRFLMSNVGDEELSCQG